VVVFMKYNLIALINTDQDILLLKIYHLEPRKRGGISKKVKERRGSGTVMRGDMSETYDRSVCNIARSSLASTFILSCCSLVSLF